MDKIKLNVFGSTPTVAPVSLVIKDAEVTITPKLPLERILDMIQWSINMIVDDRGFVSEPIKEVLEDLAIIKYYSNIDLDNLDLAECTKGELYETYDLVKAHGLVELIKARIDEEQLQFYHRTLEKTILSLVAYRNSAAGVLEIIQAQGKDSVDALQSAIDILNNGEGMEHVLHLMELVKP